MGEMIGELILWLSGVYAVSYIMFIRNRSMVSEMERNSRLRNSKISWKAQKFLCLNRVGTVKRLAVAYQVIVTYPFSALSILSIINSIFSLVNEQIQLVKGWMDFWTAICFILTIPLIWSIFSALFMLINYFALNRKIKGCFAKDRRKR